MAKAEEMAKEGRSIEASALANLADWRARALIAAMKAEPLGIPEKVQVPQAPEAAKVEKKDPAVKDQTAEKKPTVKKKPDASGKK